MDWKQVARHQHGLITAEQLAASGVSRRRVRTLLAHGLLNPVWRGLFRVAPAADSYRARLWLAVLTTGGTLAGSTAAQLWDLEVAPTLPVVVLLPHHRHVATPAGVVIRRRSRGFRTVRRAGLPVTDRPTSYLDHLVRQPDPVASQLLDRGLQQGWISVRDIELRLSLKTAGNGRLRRISVVVGDNAESELERRFHQLLRGNGVSGWTPHLAIRVGGRTFELDVGFEAQRLGIELDGLAFHTGRSRFQADRSRQNAIVGSGWRILRFTWWDLMYEPARVLAIVRSNLAHAS